ncbi:MAG: phage terminase large subunit [Solirubrobacteraceae bacterium]
MIRATFQHMAQERNAGRREPPQLTGVEFAQRFRHFACTVPEFHKPWYGAFDAAAAGTGPRRLLLLAAREFAKTSVVLTCALKFIADDRSRRVGIISGTDDLAKAFMRDVAHELEQNEALIAAYHQGPFKPPVPKKWDSHELRIAGSRRSAKDVTIFAAGATTQVSSRHVDLLIIDDAETRDTVQTAERRAATRERFAKEWLPMVSPGGIVIVIGTRKHWDDLYSQLIPKDGQPTGWTVLDNALSAIGPDGQSIWPEMWSLQALQERKAELDSVDILAWPQEYENRPIPTQTQMFTPQLWPEWDELPEGVTHFQAWDLAISERETADFTCGVDVAVDGDQNLYIVDCRYGRWNFDAQQRNFDEFGHQYPAQAIGIEAVQYQAAAVQEMARRTMLPVKALTLSRKKQRGRVTLAMDKVSRARLLEARAALGKVFLPKGLRAWKSWLMEQLAYFPSGAHDDGVDALAFAATMAQQQNADWDYAYGIYRCRQCGHPYLLRPTGYTDDRNCPK